MEPKDLLINALSSLWGLIANNGYLYIILVVVLGVVLYKVVKATFKTVIKVVGVGIAIYAVIKILSMLGIGG